ncbi:MAG: hypothetical protein H6651_23835 [Ardenticatenales bacterium]|nr:hypothetical protein [Ardenticatenales bacterium]
MSIRRLFQTLLAIALFAMGVRETLDPDLWWHLRTGELVLTTGIPHSDPFSYTFAGQPWIAHEWLADLFMWLIYSAAGLTALSLVFALIIAGTSWLLYRRCAGQPYLAAFVVLLGAVVAAPTWGARPQMFNLLLAAAFVFLIEGWQQGRYTVRVLWLLPLLTVLWANLHSGYLFGIVIIGVYVAGSWLQGHFSRHPAEVGQLNPYWLAAAGAGSFLAALLNPNGYKLWLYPFETLGSEAMQKFIVEWHAPDLNLSLFQPFAVMLGLTVLVWLFSNRPVTWIDALFFFGGAAAGLTSARNIPLFAVMNTTMLSRHLLSALADTRAYPLLSGDRPDPKISPMLKVANWFVLAVALLGCFVWSFQRVSNTQTAIGALYPVAAVDFILDSPLAEANVLNSYGWGGYLIWRDLPVFVDGRADVYGDFLFTFQQTNLGQASWREPLETYDVDYILLEQGHQIIALLTESPEWSLVYEDGVALIFVREGVAWQ